MREGIKVTAGEIPITGSYTRVLGAFASTETQKANFFAPFESLFTMGESTTSTSVPSACMVSSHVKKKSGLPNFLSLFFTPSVVCLKSCLDVPLKHRARLESAAAYWKSDKVNVIFVSVFEMSNGPSLNGSELNLNSTANLFVVPIEEAEQTHSLEEEQRDYSHRSF